MMPHAETTSPLENLGYIDIETARARSVAVPLLLPGTLVTVNTRNTVYRVTVTDGPERRVSVTGGRLFPRGTNAEVVGATDDDGNLKVGMIVEGLRMELITLFGPVITSIVESVEVDGDPGIVEEAVD